MMTILFSFMGLKELNKNTNEAVHFLCQKLVFSSWSSSPSAIIFFLLIFLFSNDNGIAINTLPKNETIPAIIVFGDSIVDPGNNNILNNSVVKCNFPPYGRDFKRGQATGRFSNGKIPSDLMAEEYGVTELLPAYLDPNLRAKDLLTGVSFASGGSGYDPLTPSLVKVFSLSEQLEFFKEYIGKLRVAVGDERTSTIISKSIYIVCAGSDDIANTYFSSPFRILAYDAASYTDLMIKSASSFLLKLYGLGARRVGVFSAPPIGCVPSQRTLSGGILRQCVESHNQVAMLFNSKLSTKLNLLNKRLPQARLVYMDVYYPLLTLLQNPAEFGFAVGDRGCCGTGTIEVTLLCNRYEPTTCTDASTYVFWDSYHPTEKAYKILSTQVLTKYTKYFF